MPLVVRSILTWILNFKALLPIPFLQPFPPLWENSIQLWQTVFFQNRLCSVFLHVVIHIYLSVVGR